MRAVLSRCFCRLRLVSDWSSVRFDPFLGHRHFVLFGRPFSRPSALRTLSTASLACLITWNLSMILTASGSHWRTPSANPGLMSYVMHRARLLGAVEPRARPEADRDVRLASAVRPVTEFHPRHHPRVGQLQGGSEQRSGIHTTKLSERPHLRSSFTHPKQRKTIKIS